MNIALDSKVPDAELDQTYENGVPVAVVSYLQKVNIYPQDADGAKEADLLQMLAEQRSEVEEVVAALRVPVPFEAEDFVVLAYAMALFDTNNLEHYASDLRSFLDVVENSPDQIKTKFTDRSLPGEEVSVAADVLCVDEEPSYADLAAGLPEDVLSRAIGPEEKYGDWLAARKSLDEAMRMRTSFWLIGEIVNRDVNLLPVVAETLKRACDANRSSVDVVVSTATALTDKQEKDVLAAIEERAQEEFRDVGAENFNVEFRVEPNVGGGLFVEFDAGSRQAVIDLTASKYIRAASAVQDV